MNFLSVDKVLVTIGDYPLSWIEFAGTVLYFASVWLIARKIGRESCRERV